MKVTATCKTFGEIVVDPNAHSKSFFKLEIVILRLLRDIYSSPDTETKKDARTEIEKIKKMIKNIHPGCSCDLVPSLIMNYNEMTFSGSLMNNVKAKEMSAQMCNKAEMDYFSNYGEIV
jgi:hypothetical protein